MKLSVFLKKSAIFIYFLIWLYFLLIWQGAIAPNISMADIQSTTGIYRCQLKSGGNFGSHGSDIVNNINYYDYFSYFYGIHSPTTCFENLNGRNVKIYFISPRNSDKNLRIELIDIDSGKIYGNTAKNQFELYKNQISDKYVFFFYKFGIFFLVNLVIFGRFISKHLRK